MDLTSKAFRNNETGKGKTKKIVNSSCNFTISNL